MSQFPYAWTDPFSGMYPSFDVFGSGGRGAVANEERNPTHNRIQPFTKPENVSHAFPIHAVEHMARQQHPPSGASSAVAAGCAQPSMVNMAGPEHSGCFLSAPCDKADCDQANICYDYADLHCAQDGFNCPDAFDCLDTNCNVDWLCTDLTCHEPSCDQDHTQDCTRDCPTVSCSDPACNEDHLYCCLSDICPHPHRPHGDCDDASCHHASSQLCHSGPAVACTQHHMAPSTIAAGQDAMSTSSISTPTTDSIHTPDNLQSLIDAASILPPVGFNFSQRYIIAFCVNLGFTYLTYTAPNHHGNACASTSRPLPSTTSQYPSTLLPNTGPWSCLKVFLRPASLSPAKHPTLVPRLPSRQRFAKTRL